MLDSELLGEGLIPTLQHAHDVLLVEHPKTVPYRATTYGQVFLSISFCVDHSKLDMFCFFFKKICGAIIPLVLEIYLSINELPFHDECKYQFLIFI